MNAEQPQANGQVQDEPFVDLEICDDYVVLCGKKVMRQKTVSVEDFRKMWERGRKQLAMRVTAETAVELESYISVLSGLPILARACR